MGLWCHREYAGNRAYQYGTPSFGSCNLQLVLLCAVFIDLVRLLVYAAFPVLLHHKLNVNAVLNLGRDPCLIRQDSVFQNRIVLLSVYLVKAAIC